MNEFGRVLAILILGGVIAFIGYQAGVSNEQQKQKYYLDKVKEKYEEERRHIYRSIIAADTASKRLYSVARAYRDSVYRAETSAFNAYMDSLAELYR